MSAPGPVEAGAWTRWHAEVEAYALAQALPMLHIYSDERRTGAAGRASTVPASGDQTDGMARMVSAIRELAELRSGHVSVVIVPSLEHLSPARDGSEQTVATLLNLYLGVSVQPIQYLESPGAGAGFTDLRPPLSPEPSRSPAGSEVLEGVLLPRDPGPGEPLAPLSGPVSGQPVSAGSSGSGPRRDRGRSALTFGDLLLGLHGDPDRVPVRVPSRTPAGPC